LLTAASRWRLLPQVVPTTSPGGAAQLLCPVPGRRTSCRWHGHSRQETAEMIGGAHYRSVNPNTGSQHLRARLQEVRQLHRGLEDLHGSQSARPPAAQGRDRQAEGRPRPTSTTWAVAIRVKRDSADHRCGAGPQLPAAGRRRAVRAPGRRCGSPLVSPIIARMGDRQERKIWTNLKRLLEQEQPRG
jgi:hypothetical protein